MSLLRELLAAMFGDGTSRRVLMMCVGGCALALCAVAVFGQCSANRVRRLDAEIQSRGLNGGCYRDFLFPHKVNSVMPECVRWHFITFHAIYFEDLPTSADLSFLSAYRRYELLRLDEVLCSPIK
jgi:hypothetical protein